MNNKTQPFIITECICSHTHKHLPKQLVFSFNSSLIIQPPLIRSRYYVRAKRVSHVVAGANERRLYPQAIIFQGTLFDEYLILFILPQKVLEYSHTEADAWSRRLGIEKYRSPIDAGGVTVFQTRTFQRNILHL